MRPDEILEQLKTIQELTLAGGGNNDDIINAKFAFIDTLIDPIIETMEQRSTDWYLARLGVLSASTSVDAMSKTAIQTTINKCISEMTVGRGKHIPTTLAMQHGIDYEDEAREAYEQKEGVKVDEVGFIFLNSDKRIGCSPDGLVGKDGMVEFKCPDTHTHIGYTRVGQPKKYFYQTQQQMMCYKAKWCDFVSYDPRAKNEELKIYVQRVYRCKKTIVTMFENLMTVVLTVDRYLDARNLVWDKNINKIRAK